MSDLPPYYFRIRENGAAVFRLEGEGRSRRLDMTQIAAVNVRSGEIRPHGDSQLEQTDIAEIEAWLAARKVTLARRDIDDIHRAVDHLNLTTQWAQSRASDDDLEDVTDRLLLAMHDLRTVLVRKKANRIARRNAEDSDQDTSD